MQNLKIKNLWALDVYFGENLVQVNCYRYKKEAIKDGQKYGEFKVSKRKVITDK